MNRLLRLVCICGVLLIGLSVHQSLPVTAASLPASMPDLAYQAPSTAPLRILAQARGIYVGAAVDATALQQESDYANVLKREYNVLTPENAMKFDMVQPSRNTYNFQDADAIVAFAQANQILVRGHTLVWYNALPDWLTSGNFSRDDLLAILHDHIQQVVGHYRGRVFAWDVVNEAIDDNGGLRDSIWLRTIGPEYIDDAFRWAREADPNALLFYNDYGGEGLGAKSDAIYKLVQGLLQRGVPINGIGLQMHVSLGKPPIQQDVEANIQRLAALGLQIHITEFDVNVQDGTGTPTDRLTAQANIYHDVATACLSSSACKALITWGFTDRHTWLGDTGTPLPFDSSYNPKPAYYAMTYVLANR